MKCVSSLVTGLEELLEGGVCHWGLWGPQVKFVLGLMIGHPDIVAVQVSSLDSVSFLEPTLRCERLKLFSSSPSSDPRH
jgi:hypothetical protein